MHASTGVCVCVGGGGGLSMKPYSTIVKTRHLVCTGL